MSANTYRTLETLASFNARKRWVFYTGKPLKQGKTDKAPHNPATGRKGSHSDPADWGTRAEAEKQVKAIRTAGWKPGVGIVLGDGLCGVDFDGCLSDGALEPWAEAIHERLATYSEISPSGGGVKAFFLVDDLEALRRATGIDNKESWMKGDHYGVELHFSAAYYTVTDQFFGDRAAADLVGDVDRLRTVSIEDMLWVIAEANRFKGERAAGGGKGDGAKTGRSFAIIREALSCIANDDLPFDEWLVIGMALHHEFGGSAEALALFHEWSARSGKYDSDDLERRWKSFGRKGGRVRTAGHILSLAERAGWRDPEDDERMFGLFTDDMVDGSPYDPPPTAYTLDEDGIIRALVDRHATVLRHDHDVARWYRFDGHWREERTKLPLAFARNIATDMAKRDPKQAKALRSYKTWANAEQGARSDRAFAVRSDIWNADSMLLGTPGGTVDLRTGKLRRGMPGDYISRVTSVAPGGECPTWLAFLEEALQGDAGAIRMFQQWNGYSLTGDTSLEQLLFVYGPGGSGKSTAINTVADIMGDYAINVGMETLTAQKHQGHTQELARLRGARMARASEIEKGAPWAEARIKMLTGRDKITARFMRQDDFEFQPEFKLTVFGNSRPTLRDVDDGMRRRLLFLPFMHQPQVKDPTLKDRLRAEWGGILSWLIAGCLDWQANGLAVPEVARAATDEYFAGQDVFGQWLAECCEVGPTYAETTAKLWESWSRYAYAAGAEPGSKTAKFPETLTQHQFKSIKDTKGIRGCGYSGLRLRPVERDEAERFG